MDVEEGTLLWRPTAEQAENSNIAAYMRWLADRGLPFADYSELWQWSVGDIDAFWQTIWDYFGIIADSTPTAVRSGADIMTQRWFPGAKLNYAEHLLRHERHAGQNDVALLHATESQPFRETTWHELGRQVRLIATRLRELGVTPGDRVCSYMPNIPEATIALLATASIGAVWAAASPEFGISTVVDRFKQIEPKVLIAADGYCFAGKRIDRTSQIEEIVRQLPSVEQLIFCSADKAPAIGCPHLRWEDFASGEAPDRDAFEYTRVESDHPLWILFSSGTTGLPKPIVHSHVGILLGQLRDMILHLDQKPGGRLFIFTTTGWMMWNVLVGGLLTGMTSVLYDGSPIYPDAGVLWKRCEESKANYFAVSPSLVALTQKAGIDPGKDYDLCALQSVLLGGAPVTPDVHGWVRDHLPPGVLIASQSGGTEVGGGLVMPLSIAPIYAGEIQTRALANDVDCWDEAGNSVVDTIGELVVKQPFPSMPLYFWNDDGGERYRNTYFDVYPNVWRHGDLFKLNQRGGCFIDGRSDATLNRGGVRIGTAEVYAGLETIAEVQDGLIVCVQNPDGTQYMPLFVAMKPGHALDAALIARIREALRRGYSPRHVPDEIIAAPAIPYTLTGKRMEVPVGRLLAGERADRVANKEVMSDPAAMDFYVAFAATLQARLDDRRTA
jgi:acetoacetyl-CoA synthetase